MIKPRLMKSSAGSILFLLYKNMINKMNENAERNTRNQSGGVSMEATNTPERNERRNGGKMRSRRFMRAILAEVIGKEKPN
jgi:hypothetical protein